MISRIVPRSGASRDTTDLYRIINKLIDAVNAHPSTSGVKGTEGKSGDIRVIQNKDGTAYIEAKTKEGWARSPVLEKRNTGV